jgi:hypothetical protein
VGSGSRRKRHGSVDIRHTICSMGMPISRAMRSAFGKAPMARGCGFCPGPGMSPSVQMAMLGRRKKRSTVASFP